MVIRHSFSHTDAVVQIVGYPAIGLMAAGLIGEALNPRNRSSVATLLNNRVLVFLGTYSYGLYVFHGMVRPILRNALGGSVASGPAMLSWVAFLATSFALSIALAFASYHLMEKRFLSLKKRLGGEV